MMSIQSKSLFNILGILLCVVLIYSCDTVKSEQETRIATFEEAMKSGRDLWGEAAMAQPNGASYDFFEGILPPPRYVNADFHYYPIILSAPNAKVKARLVSDGRGINAPGSTKSWRDVGIPFTFRVGPDEFLFGTLSDRLEEPTLAEGWLPIPQICYSHRTPYQSEGMVPIDQERVDFAPEIYRLEAFAGTDSLLSENGVVFVKFDLKQGTDGYIAVEPGVDKIIMNNGRLLNEKGQIIALFDDKWKKEGKLIKARIKDGTAATFFIATKPLTQASRIFRSSNFQMSSLTYSIQREVCVQTWKEKISQGMEIQTPESLVNNAYRNSLCQIFQLTKGDELLYSAGNQYEKLYEAEGSDAAQALLALGFTEDMKRNMIPLFNFTRKGVELFQASFKINNLCQYYWQTRDTNIIQELRPLWEREVKMLDKQRTGPNGLYPEEQYTGDIHTFVQSLNVNAPAWRAMRDLSAVLAETGYPSEGEYYRNVADQFRKIVLQAIERSVKKETSPPFIPVALNGVEPVHDPILHNRIGSYWNITIGYAIRSGIFPPGSEQENWIPHYQEQHGGICMGMVRSGGGQFNFWTGDQRINPLYGTRYSLDLLRRDDPERALVSFYGMLAQGLTRNTFVGGEGSSLAPVDKNGRFFYCPPNSAASAHILSMLRNLLVQDWDLNDDGEPETLRLGFATPRRWLEEGNTIQVNSAPTAFGKISWTVKSMLKDGIIVMNFTPPALAPEKIQIRVRIPEGWKIKSASTGSRQFNPDEDGTIDASTINEPVEITFRVHNVQKLKN